LLEGVKVEVSARPAQADLYRRYVAVSGGSLPFTDTVDISTATTEAGDLSCHDPGAELGGTPEPLSVWYRYTATEDVVLSVETGDTTPNFGDASIVALGSCGALTLVNCNAQTGNVVQVTTAPVRAGETVYIAVVDDDVSSPTGGSVQVDVTATPVVAPTPVHAGADAQVNAEFGGYQLAPDIAGAADGSFVVAWATGDYDVDPDGYGIAARQFDATGAPLTGDFLVNTYTTDSQEAPALAMRPGGDFVVVWQSYGQDGGFYDGIFAQRFDGAASPSGGEFQVSQDTAYRQAYPDVAVDATGNFLVVWQSRHQDGDDWGVFARAFDATGTPVTGEFQVNTWTTDVQSNAAVAPDPAGGFVVVWHSYGQDGSGYGSFGRRFDAGGNALGGEFQVSTHTSSWQYRPDVAGHPDGGFVVAWEESAIAEYGPVVRRWDSSGAPITGTLEVSSGVEYVKYYSGAKVAGNAAGDFLVVWPHDGDYSKLDPGTGVAGQRLTSGLQRAGDVFQVNSYTLGGQSLPAVAAAGDGFVVAFNDITEFPGRDGHASGVFGQRFTLPALATTIGVRPTKLIVVDKTAVGGGAKVVYVSKDQAAGIAKGSGEDAGDVRARFDVAYGSAHGGFVAAEGAGDGTTGWVANKLAVAKYANKTASLTPGSSIKVTVVKTGKLVKVVSKGLGDDATLDIVAAGAPAGPVRTCYEIDNGGERFRFGSEWVLGECSFKEIAGGTGRKLVCKGGTGDSTCAAAP
jgi:hypothetical protein